MPQSDAKLNILLIMTDQHRYDTLGCYVAQICQTPYLDALAARGVPIFATVNEAITAALDRI